jgi:hypothetical protein
MLDQCKANLAQWRQIDEEIRRQKEDRHGWDPLLFLDKVLETPEKILQEQAGSADIEDKKFSDSLLEEGKAEQDAAEKSTVQETSPQHSEVID